MKISSPANAANTESVGGVIRSKLARSIKKLASGFRASRNDGVGAPCTERLAAYIGRIDRAVRGLQDAVSVLRTSDCALTEIQTLLGEIRKLTLKPGDAGNSMGPLVEGIDRAAAGNVFRGDKVFTDGSALASMLEETEMLLEELLSFRTSRSERAVPAFRDMSSVALGIEGLDKIPSDEENERRLEKVDTAIGVVSSNRAHLHARITRFEGQTSMLTAGAANASAATSRITDLDMARGVLNSAKFGILSRSRVSLSGQANQRQKSVLGLMH